MRLWGAQSVSLIGTQITALALPLTAILLLDASPIEVGLLASLQYLPFLLVGLPAGSIVDRLRRRPVLIVADIGRAALLVVIPLAAWTDQLQLVMLYPIAFLVGVLTVFFDVANQSYLPSLVHSGKLVDANAKMELTYSGAQLSGPGLGGVLVQVFTAPFAILLDAISYLFSAVLLMTVRHREPAPPSGRLVDLRRLAKDMVAGLRFVVGHKLIRPLAIATGTSNFFYLFGMVGAVLILFAVRELQLSPAMLGLILVVGNLGAIAGSLASNWVINHLPFGTVMVIAPLSAALAVALIAMATPQTALPLIIAGILIGEFGVTIYDISQISLRQSVTPGEMLGRMNATVRFVNWGPIPVGAFLGGVLGEFIGLREVLWIAAVGCLLPALPLLLSNIRNLRTMPSAEPAPAAAVADG
jgi:MFS family permease